MEKLDFDPKNKEWRNYSEPMMVSLILLRFWTEFDILSHYKILFQFSDLQTMEIKGGGGGIHPPPLIPRAFFRPHTI